MPSAYELAKDALVIALKENVGALRVLRAGLSSRQEKRALAAIIDAFERYEAAWAENQQRQTDVH